MLESGTQLGPYYIRSALGAGGMGEVFLAEDTRLHRQVALKVLPENVASDKERLHRFEQEAFAVSTLNHPNILTIYEFGSNGQMYFLATEYVKGETLRGRMRQERLTISETLGIAVQIASALQAAHSAGIVHRDIKPENVMIREDALVKVLDFGLAKLSEKKEISLDNEDKTPTLVQTTPGVVMGTVAYMSPEQARGKKTDGRTDIFSLGVVLYEMLTNSLPFAGETTSDVIAAILTREPVPLDSYVSHVPKELERIVCKALRKDPEQRYQHIRDLLIDLRDLKQDLEFEAKLERSDQLFETKKTTANKATIVTETQNLQTTSSAEYVIGEIKRHKLASSVTLTILLLMIGGLGFRYFAGHSANTTQIESIAVLPFINQSGNPDAEYLSDGMTESLISSLSQLPQLSVKARSSVFRYKGKDINPQVAGNELSVQAVLLGRIAERSNMLILSLELVDARTENVIWSEQYNRKKTDLVSLQNEIARDVSNKLRTKLSRLDKQRLAKNYTENPEAYQLYLRGRYYWNRRTRENLNKAIEQFQLAVEKDPNYAPAYVGLADCYALLEEYAGTPSSETLPKAKAYAARALEIDDSLAEAHVSMGFIQNQLWQWDKVEEEFKRAIELNPNYPTAHQWYGGYLRNAGRFDEALAESKRAQELDPLSLAINGDLTLGYLLSGDLDASVEQGKKLVELDANYAGGHGMLGLAYLKQKRNAEAIAEMQKAVDLSARTSGLLCLLGYAQAVSGKRAEAVAIIKELEERYSKRESRGQNLAIVYIGLNDKDQAFAWLEKDFQVRSGGLPVIRWYPPFQALGNDPRYINLLERLGLQQ